MIWYQLLFLKKSIGPSDAPKHYLVFYKEYSKQNKSLLWFLS